MTANGNYRTEYKYIIDPQTASVISRRLGMCCAYDGNADADGFYKVTSLYFDDYSNSSLNDNIIGQVNRKKYRIRIYDDSPDYIRLEKKIKHNQVGRKASCLITRSQYVLILAGRFETLKQTSTHELLTEFCIEAMRRRLRPKVVVEYDRQTFVYTYGTVRITLDYNIRYSMGEPDLFSRQTIYAPAAEKNQVVMEVKYSGFLPNHIKALIQQGVSTRQSMSKYSLCRMRNH